MSSKRLVMPPLPRGLVPWAIHVVARFSRPLTMGVRAIILDGDQRVLLVRHSYVPGWHFPGGAIEPGETARSALLRETREEARIAIEGEPALHGLFLNRRRDHVVVYLVRRFQEIASGPQDWEIAEARFFDLRDLPPDTTDATRARLREVVEGVPVAETW